jgi:hypothetical protein
VVHAPTKRSCDARSANLRKATCSWSLASTFWRDRRWSRSDRRRTACDLRSLQRGRAVWSVRSCTPTRDATARAALRWSFHQLAERGGVGTQTIKLFEVVDGIPQSRTQTLLDLKAALESAAIEFIGAADDSLCIRLRLRICRRPMRLADDESPSATTTTAHAS